MVNSNSSDDKQLEQFLDGLLSEKNRAAFALRVESDSRLSAKAARDRTVTTTLQERFTPPQCPVDFLSDLPTESNPTSPTKTSARKTEPAKSNRRQLLAVLAIAATLLWGIVVWQMMPSATPEPVFAQLPLTDVYKQTVDGGFRPYYFCDDDVRFASTFAKRQGQELHLLELPEDRRMLGLDYPGGLSRDSTSILCEKDGQSVLVMVDRKENEVAELVLPGAMGPMQLHIHRRELGELVLYEISPLPTAAFLDYLKLKLE